ncbi:response regulator transcription factor [Sphingomonas sp. NPDC079357]|uniref:response regulator transcription factor n=1 Tax=Sphingomonas sp. NPDC079357 TaxID=3364518 RepID=UPI00384E89D4
MALHDNDFRIIIIEDDDEMRATLERYLRMVGMETESYPDTANLDALIGETRRPQIMVLDVNLPGENGFVAAARLRARSSAGIIMLTGRSGRDDRLLGLSVGVDHYLAKPVDMPELESVIRNLARRLRSNERGQQADVTAAAPAQGHWTLDLASWTLTAPNGNAIELSSAEYLMLLPLLEQPGRPNSRDLINARLGKPRLGVDNRSLDVLISRIRRKIEQGTGTPLPLRAARGTGYVFTGAAQVIGNIGS